MLQKDLTGIKGLTREDIELILSTASSFKDVLRRDIKKVPALRGKTVVNLALRTPRRGRGMTSFELAERVLGADVLNFAVSTSGVVEGETLYDTIKTIESYGVDFVRSSGMHRAERPTSSPGTSTPLSLMPVTGSTSTRPRPCWTH
ncbi:MAG: hypothetical protein MZU97_18795 [Bacillus subtilis]|nr:hypothetical protein [Bacillus subtilis]